MLRRLTRRSTALKRWGARLLIALIALLVVAVLLRVLIAIATNYMWFDSVRAGSVYTTTIEAKVVLFVVFGVIGAAIGAATLIALRRVRPGLEFSADLDTFRWTFRRYERHYGRLLVALAAIVPGILVGQRAAAGWQTYLLWAHSAPFHTTDPTFHKDSAFFVEVYPFHQMVIGLLLQAVGYSLLIALIAGYWYGTWRLRRGRQKVTAGMVRLMSVLTAGYLVLKAFGYWESRYSITTSARGPVTGAGYTDVNATLPAAYVLMSLAILGAAALIVNAVAVGRGRRMLGHVRGYVSVVALFVVVALLAGSAWPGLLFHFREAPSASKLDLPEIKHNQQATRAAFGLDGDVTTVGYNSNSSNTGDSTQITQLAGTTAQTPVIDPNQISPTFNVEQQLQAYYGFKSTLDVSHYTVAGKSQDVVLGARELRAGGIPGNSWVKTHLVYTHGYGIVAAPTTQVDPSTQSPVFLDGGMPPARQIPVSRPQIYFGQASGSSYAIVGQPAGSKQKLEFDHPAGSGSSKSAHTTYTGHGGIPIGSGFRRLLFAVQMHNANILFSSELNSASQLLTVRNPAARVAKVAPWLTLDGDVYPAVVDGKIKWIVDGYTTSNSYPDSQQINLHSATNTTLVANGASKAQPNTKVNYLHNSVKAVVDAYTGRVSLYEWNQQQHPDALLHAWESAFPKLVQPQSHIPSALLSQMRYPTDLFNVQRSLLARYHVTQPGNFYSGNDFWSVPTDPTTTATNSINATSGGSASAPLPSRYISMSADGYGAQRYSLSSPMVTLNGHQLAAFVSVDSEPGPDYGKFTVLRFPAGAGGEAPSQVQNDIESNTAITEALTLQRGGNSKVVLGALAAVPLAGRILYVEPVYTKSSGSASFPILRHVIALYGNGDPSFQNTLNAALAQAIRSASGRN